MEHGIDITKEGDGGVLKRIIKEGEGSETPHAGCDVTVHYTGTLLDGTKFDSSKDRNEPFEFPLGKRTVIRAWDIGVATMRKGEVCVLTCAPGYAYGSTGSPPKIPPNATLQFEIEMIGWTEEDLTRSKDKGILRHIIEPGQGRQHPHNEAEVTVELEGKLPDGKIFDQRTVTFILGEGADINVCEGIERALESFETGEKSRLTIQPKYAFKSKGNEELGVPPNSVVEYTVTLKNFVPDRLASSLSSEDKLEAAKMYKEKGTEYFKAKKFQLAMKKYKKILTLLNDGDVDGDGYVFQDEQRTRARELLLSAHLNLSLVCLQPPVQHLLVEKHASAALALDESNVKALFRRGQARLAAAEPQRAIPDFQRVLEIEPDNKAAAKQIAICRKMIQEQRQREKQLYSNMFDKFAKHDNEVERQRAQHEVDVMGERVGEWGAGGAEGGEWTDRQRDRKPTHFERENPNILMLDKDGRFQNM
ncbi:FK506-binding protein 59 [Epargyreus clarus]|uniref:FK506-binding protein 59 n=1 Tax=Epargyreus clarus TaxID=520877 RepID=UPI003C2BE42A